MPKYNDAPQELVNSIESAISMSGLLFQSHPNHEEWDTTRPGARAGEVAAFVRDVPEENNDYISVMFHEEGEEDADGFNWDTDSYEIIVSYRDGSQLHEIATERKRAAQIIATAMIRCAS